MRLDNNFKTVKYLYVKQIIIKNFNHYRKKVFCVFFMFIGLDLWTYFNLFKLLSRKIIDEKFQYHDKHCL